MSALLDPIKTYPRRPSCAYEYFNLGWDTQKIAAVMGIPESHALKCVSIGRAQARGLPIPYQGVE